MPTNDPMTRLIAVAREAAEFGYHVASVRGTEAQKGAASAHRKLVDAACTAAEQARPQRWLPEGEVVCGSCGMEQTTLRCAKCATPLCSKCSVCCCEREQAQDAPDWRQVVIELMNTVTLCGGDLALAVDNPKTRSLLIALRGESPR